MMMSNNSSSKKKKIIIKNKKYLCVIEKKFPISSKDNDDCFCSLIYSTCMCLKEPRGEMTTYLYILAR